MKCNQSNPGFELVSPCPFPTKITTTPRAPPCWWEVATISNSLQPYVSLKSVFQNLLKTIDQKVLGIDTYSIQVHVTDGKHSITDILPEDARNCYTWELRKFEKNRSVSCLQRKKKMIWLVSRFNSISAFVVYFMQKTSLQKKSQGII